MEGSRTTAAFSKLHAESALTTSEEEWGPDEQLMAVEASLEGELEWLRERDVRTGLRF